MSGSATAADRGRAWNRVCSSAGTANSRRAHRLDEHCWSCVRFAKFPPASGKRPRRVSRAASTGEALAAPCGCAELL
ncbi:hypothetical protein F1721_01030 [Saccharopolyspora hirsuta]|uniref:Uncharacterized protein n=1 Tax=Saccharopolyspora hirsuta TaxID=1837 RepID=A0A5M7C7M5_SACHI|nr:hypothetical protein F1721_01030 [Saccharopolyspora hirsuta]